MNEQPLGVAIVICEKVIQEVGTNNKTLVSTFNSITAASFPCAHDRMAVYVALTNGSGEKKVDLSLKKDGREKPLVRLGTKVRFEHPNRVVELIFNMRNVPFLEPGLYSFEVSSDGEYIIESRFNVILEKED